MSDLEILAWMYPAFVLAVCSFGATDRGYPRWTLDEEHSRPIIKKALELGINFFDTAIFYSDGSSEEIVGRALKDFANRDEIVVATKVYFRMPEGPMVQGFPERQL